MWTKWRFLWLLQSLACRPCAFAWINQSLVLLHQSLQPLFFHSRQQNLHLRCNAIGHNNCWFFDIFLSLTFTILISCKIGDWILYHDIFFINLSWNRWVLLNSKPIDSLNWYVRRYIYMHILTTAPANLHFWPEQSWPTPFFSPAEIVEWLRHRTLELSPQPLTYARLNNCYAFTF